MNNICYETYLAKYFQTGGEISSLAFFPILKNDLFLLCEKATRYRFSHREQTASNLQIIIDNPKVVVGSPLNLMLVAIITSVSPTQKVGGGSDLWKKPELAAICLGGTVAASDVSLYHIWRIFATIITKRSRILLPLNIAAGNPHPTCSASKKT